MALVRWATRPPGGGGHYTTADLAWNAFNGIEGTLMSYVLPPKVAAELYRALGDIPRVTVDKDAVDAAGRRLRLGVRAPPTRTIRGGGWTAEVFLNPHTFQLTGYAEHFPDKCACPSPGTGGTAILRQALVRPGPGLADESAGSGTAKPITCDATAMRIVGAVLDTYPQLPLYALVHAPRDGHMPLLIQGRLSVPRTKTYVAPVGTVGSAGPEVSLPPSEVQPPGVPIASPE